MGRCAYSSVRRRAGVAQLLKPLPHPRRTSLTLLSRSLCLLPSPSNSTSTRWRSQQRSRVRDLAESFSSKDRRELEKRRPSSRWSRRFSQPTPYSRMPSFPLVHTRAHYGSLERCRRHASGEACASSPLFLRPTDCYPTGTCRRRHA